MSDSETPAPLVIIPRMTAAVTPDLGDGWPAALTNYGFMARRRTSLQT